MQPDMSLVPDGQFTESDRKAGSVGGIDVCRAVSLGTRIGSP